MAMSVTFTNFGGRVVHENRGGVERDYVRDPLGNTVALVDMNGNVTDTYSHWPSGETRVHRGSSDMVSTFDPVGREISVIELASGQPVVTMIDTFDGAGRKTSHNEKRGISTFSRSIPIRTQPGDLPLFL